jgi:multicomponent K+:H+ antiporter subunit G
MAPWHCAVLFGAVGCLSSGRILLRDIVISLLIVISAIGLVCLPDFLSRLHAPTKAATLGVGSLLLASALYFGSLHEL